MKSYSRRFIRTSYQTFLPCCSLSGASVNASLWIDITLVPGATLTLRQNAGTWSGTDHADGATGGFKNTSLAFLKVSQTSGPFGIPAPPSGLGERPPGRLLRSGAPRSTRLAGHDSATSGGPDIPSIRPGKAGAP